MILANGDQKAHIRDRIKKVAGIMKQIWGIGKRRFKKDWKRRMWLFDTTVWPVIGCGTEIWGWRMEDGDRKFAGKVYKVDVRSKLENTGIYGKETQRDKLRTRAGKRAWKFEEKLKEGRGGELAIKCWKEIEGRRVRLTKSRKWEEERKKFFRDREIGNVDRVKYEEIEKRDREEQVIEIWGKGWGERRWTRIARFRRENEVKKCMYWEKEENRKCRICEWEEETWKHVWERYVRERKLARQCSKNSGGRRFRGSMDERSRKS